MVKEVITKSGKLTAKYNILINKSELNKVLDDITATMKQGKKITIEVKHGFL